MIDINEYVNSVITECRAVFGERLIYLGLQGSYLRGEANENSDIDIMLVLDSLSVEDMDNYRDILIRVGHFEKSCGFICGRAELARWNPLEVCQIRHTTKDILGSLDALLPQASREDEVNYVKLSLGNLYHELCHRYIHAERSRNEARFRGSCKALFFLIQNLHYLESGTFVLKKSELRARVSQADREMLSMAELESGFDFDCAFAAVFDWCKKAFLRVEALQHADNEGKTMLEIDKLSSKYLVRRMSEHDAERILALCRGNMLFYEYAQAEPTVEEVLNDLRMTPPGIEAKDKYYIGFFEGETLAAVMDLIDGFPEPDIAFIGFFMMDATLQGRGTGSFIIAETAEYLRSVGKTAIRLGIDAENPQSNAFWRKNGFITIEEVDRGGNKILLAEKKL